MAVDAVIVVALAVKAVVMAVVEIAQVDAAVPAHIPVYTHQELDNGKV